MMTLLPLLALAAAPVGIVAPHVVNLPDRLVHVSDVVTGTSALPPAARRLVLARLPRGAGRISLTRAALASLVRRGLPGVALADRALAGKVTFMVPAPGVAPRAAMPVPRARPAIERGATLHLTSRAGPVRIERPVTALQSSMGRRVFVRDADGAVFAVRVARAERRP